ncbi:gluconokinase [Spelaeicoccus albus]|uniref:Gluconokinase n=1 Tax=Spelaeicoccus albus TaxID=1280376 RepID=A0A7Z0D2W4_9MICO|nr:gluconokinase [Spelaeicoccus albus]NYI67823.1 gluconokinase [Spelaeicoccus albus]
MTANAQTAPTVLVIMGVSGCGKSTVASGLASRLGWEFAEGDDFHPRANVDKMHDGHPLTDEDRWPWLRRIADWIAGTKSDSAPGIVTCSALKRSYRDVLRAPGVVFVHLTASKELLEERLSARKGHFMPADLLQSQLDTLEPLGPDERGIVVDVAAKPDEIVDSILTDLSLAYSESPRD